MTSDHNTPKESGEAEKKQNGKEADSEKTEMSVETPDDIQSDDPQNDAQNSASAVNKTASDETDEIEENLDKKDDAWTELAKTVIMAVLLAFIVRALFFEPFNIPSGSMKPTLLVGD